MRRALSWRDGLALQAMIDTGLRVSDCLALRIAALHNHTIRVTERKTGHTRTVRLRPSTRAEILRHVGDRPLASRIWPIDRSTYYRAIKAAALALGMERVSAHSARKTYARAYARKHGALATQRELGHKYISTTLLYLHDVD